MSIIKALVSLATMSGCIIHTGELGKTDTGMEAAGDMQSKADYIVLPSAMAPGTGGEVLLTASPKQEWGRVVALDVMGPMTIDDFVAEDNGLVLQVTVLQDAELGPVHIVLEFDDGSFDIARDVISIQAVEEPAGDTGIFEDEPEG